MGYFLKGFSLTFSDFIGTCGKKELKIESNQNLAFSGVKVMDRIQIGTDMFIFKLRESDPNPGKEPGLKEILWFIEQALHAKHACPFDKDLYRDLDSEAKVHDPADWYLIDRGPEHWIWFEAKVGTIYALMRSIYRHNRSLFKELADNVRFPLTGGELDIVFFKCRLYKGCRESLG